MLVPVHRPQRLVPWIALATVVAVLGFYLFPSDARQIRRHLDTLAATVSFAEGPPKAMDFARMRAALKDSVADPLSLDVAELGEKSYAGDDLIQGYALYAQDFRALSLKFEDVQIELGKAPGGAIVSATLIVEQTEPSGIRRTEPRRFAATLAKHDGTWRIVHVKVLQSRIDQPEARP